MYSVAPRWGPGICLRIQPLDDVETLVSGHQELQRASQEKVKGHLRQTMTPKWLSWNLLSISSLCSGFSASGLYLSLVSQDLISMPWFCLWILRLSPDSGATLCQALPGKRHCAWGWRTSRSRRREKHSDPGKEGAKGSAMMRLTTVPFTLRSWSWEHLHEV